ncbi:unnamed protein product [Paramecium sonneborni]|uniref:Uncharacterized protein n=1 Tax=Paramecium sonneborni TaxID=65129 RepID=A0A8S1RFK6_9CILI|nr:unnamed protein product [Paramecium sonneborni]
MNNDRINKKRDKSSNDVKSLLTQPSMLFTQKAEENIIHVIQQVQPLRTENDQLKNTILATQNYLEQQRENLSQIIRDTESRELVKRIADIPTLITILQEDMKTMQETLRTQSLLLTQQTDQLLILNEERNSNYERIKIEVSRQAIEQQQIITHQEELIQSKDQTIQQLNQLIEDENKKIKKNQNSHFEVLDSYNEKLEELTNQLNEEIEKQAQIKLKYTQMLQQQQEEHHTQVAIKQDQYEFALGELRNTYEKRMDKLIKDSEFRISEANKASIRANKELEQVRNKYEQEIQKNEQQIILIKNQQLQLQQQQQQTQQLRAEMHQQSLYLHQTQAMIANLKKNNNIVLTEGQILLEQKIQQQFSENFYLTNPTNHFSSQTQFQQEIDHQQQQTSPSLWPQDIRQFSPSSFKLNPKNADQQTTQISPISNYKQTQEKIPNLELEEIMESKKQTNLMKKLRKKRNQRSKNREDQYYYQIKTNDGMNSKELMTGPSPKLSEETPNSKFVSVNFTQALTTHHSNLRRRSKLQINFSNNQIKEQEINQEVQTQDISCQTEDFLLEYFLINENQKTIHTHPQERSNSYYFSPTKKNQISNIILDNSSKNQHQFSNQILQSDQDEFQVLQKDEVTILKEQIAQLQTQNQIQTKNITDLQEKAQQMQERMKENVKQMKQQIQRSSQENEALLKQLEKPKEVVKKKIELQKHLENQITQSENLQNQLTKAAEIIKYFNNELENYKQMYNIFGQGTKSDRLQTKKLPSIYQPSPKRKIGECTPRKQQSMYEEAQKLIDNLYDIKTHKRN